MKTTSRICLALAVLIMTTSPCRSAQDELLQPRQTSAPIPAEPGGVPKLSPPAQQLAEQLKVLDLMRSLRSKQEEYQLKGDTRSLLEVVVVRQQLLFAMQHAAIEVEEAVAAIDGDLTLANMLLDYASARQDRSVMLNNIATFVGSGTFGLLDSSTGLKLGVPTPQILGIVSNSIATGLPVLGFRRQQYQNPRTGQHAQTNMLAPIFGRPFSGESYDPLVWSYIDGMPAEPGKPETRRQLLLQRWKMYRGIGTTGSAAQHQIDALVGMPKRDEKVTVELLKTRAELLFDLRSVVQQMYRDISELNTAILAL